MTPLDAAASAPPQETPPAEPVPGQTQLFAPDGYKVTKVEAVLGGITIDDNTLAEAKLNDELHLNIRDARVVAVQYRQDGTKRITLHAETFKPTITK